MKLVCSIDCARSGFDQHTNFGFRRDRCRWRKVLRRNSEDHVGQNTFGLLWLFNVPARDVQRDRFTFVSQNDRNRLTPSRLILATDEQHQRNYIA